MDPLVVAAFLLTISLEIAIPLLLGFFIARRLKVSWRLFLLGLAFFLIVQVVHTPLVLLTQGPLTRALQGFTSDPLVLLGVLALYLGIMAGLFEEIGRYLVFRYYFAREGTRNTRENALMFGAGWGGVESIIVGFLLSLTLVSYLYAATALSAPGAVTNTAETQFALLLQITPVDVLFGLAERLMTITLQIAFTLMVMYSVMRRTFAYLLLAIAWHAAVDAIAVYASQTIGIPATEGLIFLFFLAGLAFIFRIWPRMISEKPGEPPDPASTG
ncbi:putative membrane protein YhfC [Methanolinea mesophila]|uniref:YhfC family glutamic-type intramembrane protease n=1 Tax=Methanolinea mesophila TaxID=547055 RepID=UPI001AE611A6|nr:YhfC family glutamic-type intramembrane protease [Methanolinea mesophila]MBP1929595.1 putative membrane protein YhfC [Methanolinea mesophila]